MRPPLKVCRLVVSAHVMAFTATGAAAADILSPGDVIMVQAAPAAIHFHDSDNHAKYSWLIGAEWEGKSRWIAGLSYFNNSFDQKCEYIYAGRVWTLGEDGSNWYVKMTGGLLLGYKEPYQNKIPVNSNNGVGLGVVPALGYKMDRFNVQVNLLGTAGLMITVGYDLFR